MLALACTIPPRALPHPCAYDSSVEVRQASREWIEGAETEREIEGTIERMNGRTDAIRNPPLPNSPTASYPKTMPTVQAKVEAGRRSAIGSDRLLLSPFAVEPALQATLAAWCCLLRFGHGAAFLKASSWWRPRCPVAGAGHDALFRGLRDGPCWSGTLVRRRLLLLHAHGHCSRAAREEESVSSGAVAGTRDNSSIAGARGLAGHDLTACSLTPSP